MIKKEILLKKLIMIYYLNSKDILNYMKNNDFNLDKKYYQNILSSEVPPPTILRGTADEFKLLIPELKLNNEFVWIISNVEGSYKGNKGIYLGNYIQLYTRKQ
ncbi:hypothetical protein CHRYSEO8AT_50001 [Chryseobacterium sp. 8AT]|nr:hypothetical protein CHRYSEO8AT_50001 [Chryseobacterium sp. 8AT]